MTASTPKPKPPRAVLWGACERCGAGGTASTENPRLCTLCGPPPEVEFERARTVDRRIRLARHAAARTDALVDSTALQAVPPDAEHIWLRNPASVYAHLFRDGAPDSYCGRMRLRHRVRADLDEPAPEATRTCKACRRVFEAGRGRGL